MDFQQNDFAIESQNRPTHGDPTSLSTKLKYKKLIEMFPGVDQTVLSELFKANKSDKFINRKVFESVQKYFFIPVTCWSPLWTLFVTVLAYLRIGKRNHRRRLQHYFQRRQRRNGRNQRRYFLKFSSYRVNVIFRI